MPACCIYISHIYLLTLNVISVLVTAYERSKGIINQQKHSKPKIKIQNESWHCLRLNLLEITFTYQIEASQLISIANQRSGVFLIWIETINVLIDFEKNFKPDPGVGIFAFEHAFLICNLKLLPILLKSFFIMFDWVLNFWVSLIHR